MIPVGLRGFSAWASCGAGAPIPRFNVPCSARPACVTAAPDQRPLGAAVGTNSQLSSFGHAPEDYHVGKAHMYRAYAEECFRLASAAGSPDSRAVMLEMARTWHQLAQAEETVERQPEGCEPKRS